MVKGTHPKNSYPRTLLFITKLCHGQDTVTTIQRIPSIIVIDNRMLMVRRGCVSDVMRYQFKFQHVYFKPFFFQPRVARQKPSHMPKYLSANIANAYNLPITAKAVSPITTLHLRLSDTTIKSSIKATYKKFALKYHSDK